MQQRNPKKAPHCTGMHHMMQRSSKSAKRLQRYRYLSIFQYGGRPPSWFDKTHICTSHEGYLLVTNIVQNLVEIDPAVLIICNFFIMPVWLKMPIHAPPPKKWDLWGFEPLNGKNSNAMFHKRGNATTHTPKRHLIAQKRVI